MEHIHHQLNFWAVLVSALVLWFLGAVWYSPMLFAKPWVEIVGRRMGDKPKGVVQGMVSSFIGDLLMALVLSHMVIWSGATGAGHGAFVGFLAWLGFIAAPAYPQSVYEGRPFKYFAINGGYWLIGLLLVGILLTVWR
jgi:hypothetical protein